jgi:hypothetical protein
LTQPRLPSHKTLQREVAVLLQTYAQPVPARTTDPEDAQDCPFIELGILNYFTDSGNYRVRDEALRSISLEALGYVVSTAFPAKARASHVEFTLHEGTLDPGGPGRVFVLSGEALFDRVSRFELAQPKAISIRAMAGERLIRMPARPALNWLRQSYDLLGREVTGAA